MTARIDGRTEQVEDRTEQEDDRDKLLTEINALRQEVNALKLRVKNLILDEPSFADNSKKVTTYTGLPNFMTLKSILDLISPNLRTGTLTKFQQLLLALMRLKVNVATHYLIYDFNINQSTVSWIFTEVIHVLLSTFVPITIYWPDSEDIITNVPIDKVRLYHRLLWNLY